MQKPAPQYSLDLVFHPEHDAAYVHFDDAAAQPFQPNPAGFPRVNAWWLAECALASYWDEAGATALFTAAGLQSQFIRAGSTDCYLAWRNEFVIVTFRGTEPDEWDDGLTDVKMALVPWQTGKVHRGFKEAIEAIWPALEIELQGLAAGRTVWFCGHSLGAALAVLAADRFADPAGVCTFGCPRVGDHVFAAAFSAKLAARTLRYVNHNDVVTHMPPPVFGYKHVARVRVIATDGTISSQPPSISHFFSELLGPPAQLLENIHALSDGTLKVPPNYLLEHMPKAYAIWTWNDYDTHG